MLSLDFRTGAVAVGAIVVIAGITGVLGGFGALGVLPADGPDLLGGDDTTAATCTGEPQFQTADGATLNYSSSQGVSGGTASPDYNGVFTVDYDDDGWTDVLLIGGDRPTLFENTGGQFEPSGLLPADAYEGRSINSALFFDYDGDGREDLLLLPATGAPIYLENTPGGFEVRDIGFDGVELNHPAAVSTADYDDDGDLDLYVGQYGSWSEQLPTGAGTATIDAADDNGVANLFLRNTGSGFENATAEVGISGNHWTLAASFVDFTGDGRPDIHVANDFYNDTLYVNEGDGTFRRTVLDGATDRNAMSSEVADFDGDGRPDIFVTNIYFRGGGGEKESFLRMVRRTMGDRMDGNNLLINRGNGSFVDRASEFGIRRGGWGWSATATDFDNDGALDLFHANQDIRKSPGFRASIGSTPYLVTPMYWDGNGSSFDRLDARDVGFEETDGRGVAALDYDNDGDRDILLTNIGGSYKLYENRVEGCHSLSLRVEDDAGSPAFGATVTVEANGSTQHFFVGPRADYQSQEPREVHVGLGDTERVDRVLVTWPDGTELTFEDVAADRRLVVSPSGIESAAALNESAGG